MRLLKELLNINIVVNALDAVYNPWRRGRLGKIADRHSPTAHMAGEGCWCQKNLKKAWNVGQSFAWGTFQAEMSIHRQKFDKNGGSANQN